MHCGAGATAPQKVSDGIRTRDRRDHNPELYQLSYAHQASTESSGVPPVPDRPPIVRSTILT